MTFLRLLDVSAKLEAQRGEQTVGIIRLAA